MMTLGNGTVLEVDYVRPMDDGYAEVKTDDGTYYVFSTLVDAGHYAAEYYREMADRHPRDFREIIGDDQLIQWGLGNGSREDYFQAAADDPASHLGRYDGEEHDVTCNQEALDDLGFTPEVAYRCN